MENRLAEIEKKMNELQQEKEKILREQDELECEQNWRDLSIKVKNCSIENMMAVELEQNTKTLPIFDEFEKNSKAFLLLKNIGYFSLKTGEYPPSPFDFYRYNPYIYEGINFSLILCKSWKRLYQSRSNITPTKLKKAFCLGCIADLDNYTNIRNSSSLDNDKLELEPLWKELNSTPFIEFVENIKQDTKISQKTFTFSKPILMGAQTTKNREGYGNVYNGETLIHKGTEYGETTRFLIVGCILHDKRL